MAKQEEFDIQFDDAELEDFAGDSEEISEDTAEFDESELEGLGLDDDTAEEIQNEADDSDIDKQIAQLKMELGDDDGSSGLMDNSELLDDEDELDFSKLDSANEDFLSSTGEVVLMDPNDDGTCFKLKYVDIKNIAVTKRIRATGGFEDLVKSIKSTGLLKPISVAPTNSDGVFVLLDGYRRLLACARAGKRDIPCIINTKVSVPDIPILEAMYNQQKAYSINEQIAYIDYLEKQKGIMSASLIEYLLQMNSGDYSKLKDILEDNDEEIVGKLTEGLITIGEAFRKLEQRRKKENPDQKDMRKATKVYDEDPDETIEAIAGSGETGDEDLALSDAELNNISVNANELDDVEDDDLESMIKEGNNISGYQPHKQNYKYREILDPTLRKAVLARDNNTCRICGLSGQEFTEVLDVHHIQEVYLGGDDSMDNLITACTVCHKLIHMYGRGTLHIRPIDQFSDNEQTRFKKIVKLGNKIRVDSKLKGVDPKKLKEIDNSETIGRTKPGNPQEAG